MLWLAAILPLRPWRCHGVLESYLHSYLHLLTLQGNLAQDEAERYSDGGLATLPGARVVAALKAIRCAVRRSYPGLYLPGGLLWKGRLVSVYALPSVQRHGAANQQQES